MRIKVNLGKDMSSTKLIEEVEIHISSKRASEDLGLVKLGKKKTPLEAFFKFFRFFIVLRVLRGVNSTRTR